ncbi:MAG: CHASE2 domain-containing protein [Betaproteobacteria bacterium]|nr:CHASE2 domain-containing protein [Betaproteobacteria bacterium]
MKPALLSILQGFGSWCRRWEARFYLLLAVVIAVFLLADYSLQGFMGRGSEEIYDQLIKLRISSPAPDSRIVIIDIDERSLQEVGRDQGRWPWSNSVVAEALATIAEESPQAILLNQLVSEPSKSDPEGDASLNEIAGAYPNIVFPFVRLPAANDGVSQLDAARVPGARAIVPAPPADPVAVILPLFENLQKRMGASNLYAEGDGIIRRYQYWVPTESHVLPSTAAVIVQLAGGTIDISDEPNAKLNWRNKRRDYRRVSFADLYAASQGRRSFDWSMFAGKIVIIGATAPGISVIKPTSASIITDDSTIIATAIDDALNGTALRMMPAWVALLLALGILVAMSRAFMAGADQSIINRVFFIGELALIVITFFSVSFSNFVIDMTLPFNAGLLYFTVAKTYFSAQHATELGVEYFWDSSRVGKAHHVVIIALHIDRPGMRGEGLRIRRLLEREVSHEAVLYLTDFVDVKTFLGKEFGDIELLVTFLPEGTAPESLQSIVQARQNGHEVLLVDIAGLNENDTRAKLWREVVRVVFPMYLTEHARAG